MLTPMSLMFSRILMISLQMIQMETIHATRKSELTVMKMNRLRYGEYYTKTYVDEKNYLHWLPTDQDAPEGSRMPLHSCCGSL